MIYEGKDGNKDGTGNIKKSLAKLHVQRKQAFVQLPHIKLSCRLSINDMKLLYGAFKCVYNVVWDASIWMNHWCNIHVLLEDTLLGVHSWSSVHLEFSQLWRTYSSCFYYAYVYDTFYKRTADLICFSIIMIFKASQKKTPDPKWFKYSVIMRYSICNTRTVSLALR